MREIIKSVDDLVNSGNMQIRNVLPVLNHQEIHQALRNLAIIISNSVRHTLLSRNAELTLSNSATPAAIETDTAITFTMAAILAGFALGDDTYD